MKLHITTNWDDKLLEGLDSLPIESIAGRLPQDIIGAISLTQNNLINKISKKKAKNHINKINKKRIKFAYILDSTCLNAIEYTQSGRKKILEHIKWISDLGVDAVIVSLPVLVKMIKIQFPDLKVIISLVPVKWAMFHLKYFESLGVEEIILPECLNRNFSILKSVLHQTKCKVRLILNSGCTYHCPLNFDHMNFLSHASQTNMSTTALEYYNLLCSRHRLFNPQDIIKAPWIRPEDIEMYEKIGYENFIIRSNGSSVIEQHDVIYAYSQRTFTGNLIDLLSARGMHPFFNKNRSFKKAIPIVNNKDLDDFLKNFPEIDCATNLCEDCGYCEKVAKKAVKMPQMPQRNKFAAYYNRKINIIQKTEMLSY